MKSPNKIFCVISHTHWDREWYMPLENFRHRLTDLMDRLLTILADHPDYIFHLDAQTVVLEDYLAVRPEKKELLRHYISNRRIMVGPWYLQNDFYLTSGEATVRNLLEGRKLTREFGGVSKAGYAADQFGNPDQLPQILKNFGMDNFIFGRGIAKYDLSPEGKAVPKPTPTEFIWRGADGTEVLAIHMRHWYNNAQRFSSDTTRALKYLKQIEAAFDNEYTLTPYLLLMNGVDHLEAQPDILEVTEAVQKELPEGQHFLQYNLDDYVEDVKAYLSENDIHPEVVEGELRQSYDIVVLQGTLSSRHYLKVQNTEAQILLENRLEPLYAMMELAGMKGVTPKDRLVYTWKNLMRNHPHDSICGCSHDAVHRHMENRYAEIFEFAGEQLRRGMQTAGEHTAASRNGGEQDYLVTVANTQAFPLSGVVTVRIRLATADDMEAFRLIDGEGHNVPFRLLSKKKTDTNVYSPINLPGKVEVWDQEIAFDAGEVAPYAFKTFLIVKASAVPALASPVERKDLSSIENGLLKLTCEKDGSLTLTDLRTGRVLADFLDIEDRADRGNSYTFLPGGDKPLGRADFPMTYEITEANDLRSSMVLRYALPLPASYDFEAGKRTGEALSALGLTLTLQKNEPYLHIDYALDNRSADHRLRLVYRGDVESERAFADVPFEIVSHTKEDFYPGTPARLSPNASFAAIQAEGKGYAVFTVGAHEYEHIAPNALALTILRATGAIETGGTENWLTPENQCIRKISGRMAFSPFTGDLISARIPQLSLAFRAPLLGGFTACDTRKFAGGRPCVQDTEIHEYFYLPDDYPEVSMENNRSLLDVTGDGIVVTALKKSEDESGMILRFVNLSSAPTEATVTHPGKIFRTKMDEVARSFLGRGQISLPVGPNEIVTLFLN